eukprot:TRINITY_DN8874_c0_g1_i1.p1 TRINITY_DN8874_c0_g1~~TRINITY_DN8874_c0_g1_i1.p1  ORF type:complete len:249 (-),score=23.22 TRINITY_DN8874_c0_g1_i1:182-928(-)
MTTFSRSNIQKTISASAESKNSNNPTKPVGTETRSTLNLAQTSLITNTKSVNPIYNPPMSSSKQQEAEKYKEVNNNQGPKQLVDENGEVQVFVTPTLSQPLAYRFVEPNEPNLISRAVEVVTLSGDKLNESISLCFVVADDFIPERTLSNAPDCKVPPLFCLINLFKLNRLIFYDETRLWSAKDVLLTRSQQMKNGNVRTGALLIRNFIVFFDRIKWAVPESFQDFDLAQFGLDNRCHYCVNIGHVLW